MEREKIKTFQEEWKDRGDEKQDTGNFWTDFLTAIGVKNPSKILKREKPVYVNGRKKYIDVYLEGKRTLVEQKSLGIDLDKKELQSDGELLTPYEQAKRYANNLPYDERVSRVATCNFGEFRLYDLKKEKPEQEPVVIKLSELDRKLYMFDFLRTDEDIPKGEEEVSVQAGRYVKELYDLFLKQYGTEDPEILKDLNVLCVRLVFLFYCEDAGIFKKDQFLKFLKASDERHIGSDLNMLFEVLNTRERKDYLSDMLKAFPYVNGGLFGREIEIPKITKEILDKMIDASESFDWSYINPTIIGATLESTMNPETRRTEGVHFTSVKNIHRVIDPLFLNDLRKELKTLLKEKNKKKLRAFQDKLAGLTFLDPACGSGNFLTETYLCLREMENEVIRELYGTQIVSGIIIKVSIQQFFGIEINDFACSIAMTSLWIAEAQTAKKTMDIVHQTIDFLPLKSLPNIKEGNSLTEEWPDTDYIMGNPPFIGYSQQSREQKEDCKRIFNGNPKAGKLDYCACWYRKAFEHMPQGTRAAFVSTNSICQGEQVATLWKDLFNEGLKIQFCYRSFKWGNEAQKQAQVSVIIIGFGRDERERFIYDGDTKTRAKNINAYLMDGENIFVEARRTPLCDVPPAVRGLKPSDGSNLILTAEQYEEVKDDPQIAKWIRPFSMGGDFINGVKRYCLWLDGISPREIKDCLFIYDRVKKLKEWRNSQVETGDAYKLKDTLMFRPSKELDVSKPYIAIPVVSSNDRQYIPMGFIENGMIPGNKLFTISTDSLYTFGVLMSSVHMEWMRITAGRIGVGYSYISSVTYNCFPWPLPTEEQKARIGRTAQSILDARAKYPDSSLADLYDPLTMPKELRDAHRENDKAVLEAYGFKKDIIPKLMERYLILSENSGVREG